MPCSPLHNAGGGGSYPPLNCPCRHCRFNGVGDGMAGHGPFGIHPQSAAAKAGTNVEALLGTLVKNLGIAIAVELKALEVFPQNASSNLAGGERPGCRRSYTPHVPTGGSQ